MVRRWSNLGSGVRGWDRVRLRVGVGSRVSVRIGYTHTPEPSHTRTLTHPNTHTRDAWTHAGDMVSFYRSTTMDGATPLLLWVKLLSVVLTCASGMYVP